MDIKEIRKASQEIYFFVSDDSVAKDISDKLTWCADKIEALSSDSEVQKFFIGQRVHYKVPREPALRDVPDIRLCSDGIIDAIFLRKGKAEYRVHLDREVLSESVWQCDAERISLITKAKKGE